MKHLSFPLLSLAALLASCATPSNSSVTLSSSQASQTIVLEEISKPYNMHSRVQQDYLDSGIPEEMDFSIADGKHENSKPVPLTLSWQGSSNESYQVLLSENPSFTNAKTYGVAGTSLEITNLKIASIYYWKVASSSGESKVSSFRTTEDGPRNIDIDGVTNVRDIGGWETNNGSRIKQGLLYRGARLNDSYPEGWVKGGDDKGYEFTPEITSPGAETFQKELGIKTEIDMRVVERNGYPGLPPEEVTFSAVEGVRYIAVPTGGSANINQSKDEIKRIFGLFADKTNYPMYFHCNIGTDRTGMIAYLLNAYLGVNEINLYFDYLFSNFGLIAVPNAYSSDPTHKTLLDLTKPTGAAGVVSAFAGDTLQEKATNCLLNCGVTSETLQTIRSILLDE